MKCMKCSEPHYTVLLYHWGEVYSLCSLCADVFESYPSHVYTIKDFLKKPDNKIDKNIQDARYRRAKGENTFQT